MSSSTVAPGGQPAGVCPGDDVSSILFSNVERENVGNGLALNNLGRVMSLQGGSLSYDASTRSYSIKNESIRIYNPIVGDQVIGIIDDRGGDHYKVNIFASAPALLNRLSFDGATKRNKPDLHRGDIIYGRIEKSATKYCDTELSCVASTGTRKDWSSGETIYGELSGGIILKVSMSYARSLLQPQCPVLNRLGKELVFEVAVGVNGLVWVKSSDCFVTVVIRNAILNAEDLDAAITEAMVDKLLLAVRKRSNT